MSGNVNGAKDGIRLEDGKLGRGMGLMGGIALAVGGVIGMGIYALIAPISAQAGSSLWLAFTVAILISAIGVIPLIQIASALPRAGGGYLFTSRFMNPMLGTITSWWAILGGACSSAFVSLGMAGYIVSYLPWSVPIKLVALIMPVLLFLLYMFGLRLASTLQVFLTAQLIVALLVYGIAGSMKSGLDLTLSFPQGSGGFIMACILSYSVCVGFQVIAEMGEEMVNARRNIPLSLVIGGTIVFVIYFLVGTVFVGMVPYDFEAIAGMSAPLKTTGEQFLSGFWVMFLSVGAISAGLTSLNAGAIALPRELFSQARDGIVPVFMGKIHERSQSPLNAVGVYFLLVIGLILASQDIGFYGVMTAVGILLMTAVISIAALMLPSKYPERYAHAYLRVPMVWLVLVAIVSVLSCVGFIAFVLLDAPTAGYVYIIWTAIIAIYYLLRVKWLKSKGVDIKDRMQSIPGFDEDNRED
jgi:amino acid transporter